MLVLPSGDQGAVQTITLPMLAGWLDAAETQFVYLNCCSGLSPAGGTVAASTLAAVPELMTASAPVILGMRWNIFDKRAYQFSARYYKALLAEGMPFDAALQRVRNDIYRANPEDIMWAAPILLLQARETGH